VTTRFTILSLFLSICLAAMLVNGCKKGNTGPAGNGTTPLEFKVPAGWPQPQGIFADNPLTQEGFDLGKKLFYDGKLSKDGNFPCASCHQQFAAFANFDHDLSHGFNNAFTTRNSPGLFNMAWQKEFMWDGGINHLELQPLAPIQAANEMNETLDNVLNKLRADPDYPRLFKAAFGDEAITSQRMLKSMAQFVGFLVSSNAKYDKVKRNELTFNASEQRGYNLFQTKCATCHKEPLFTDLSYRNTGMPINPQLRDMGRMRITNLRSDSLKFKVPSLRNVMLTYPYTHDGRFYTVDAVLNHYSNGIISSPTLDPLLVNKIPMTAGEKQDIISFLYTLTDTVFIKDIRYR
jgi:cytochrome c peroxidase